MEDIGVYHGSFGEESLRGRCQVAEIAVEEYAEQRFWDPGEDCFLAEDVEGEEGVDEGVAGDNPFFRTGEDGGGFRVGVDDEFEGFDCGGAAADYEGFFASGGFTVEFGGVVDFAFEGFLAGYMGHFWFAATADGGHDSVEAAVRRVVDDPAALLVFIDGRDTGVEFGAVLQAVAFPELGDLGDDLVAVGVAGGPVDRGVKTVHYTVDLETGCVVDLLGDG